MTDFINGMILGQAMSADDAAYNARTQLQIEKCKTAPTKREVLVCLERVDEQLQAQDAQGAFIMVGLVIIVGVVGVWLYRRM